LCARCHHRLHRDGWEVEVRGAVTRAGVAPDSATPDSATPDSATRDGAVRFIPPRSVDATRTPRLGGRERYDLAA
jgi:hypothetical protein